MDTLKTKLQNQITSYLISFQYFVHPPGVASTVSTVYSLITCVYEYTVLEWPHTSDE